MVTVMSASTPFNFIKLGGGLNDTGSPFDLQDNESPDLKNIDLDKFGAVMPRNGYQIVNTASTGTTNACLGLY